MKRTQVKLSVYVDLDPFPGVFNTADSAKTVVQSILLNSIPHYNPAVQIDDPDVHSATPVAKDAVAQ